MTDATSSSAWTNANSAAPSALGYFAQVEYALLLTLRRMDTELDFGVSIETLDDIVFDADGEPAELLQSKHHVERSASLTNNSPDLWKSIGNWIANSTDEMLLTLITNATAPAGSAMALLRSGPGRDPQAALTALETAARTSENAALATHFATFLGVQDRLALVSRITLVDELASVADLEHDLELAIRKSTTARHRPALLIRLRGWWAQKVYDHLTRVAAGEKDRILSAEVDAVLGSLAQQLRDDDLPIDFYDMPLPGDTEAAQDDRAFVHQLRLIALGSARIRQCIYDHNRAFAQRSRWEREKLLHVGELKEFEARLVDEWRRMCLPDTDAEGETDDEEAIQARARDRFIRLDQSVLPRIRPHVATPYVANGSLHMLADRLEIGWHPAWLERLRQVLPQLAAEADGVA